VGILFISPLAFVFGVLHWDEARVPMILMIVGTAAHIIGQCAS
jgi:hypothetical protein